VRARVRVAVTMPPPVEEKEDGAGAVADALQGGRVGDRGDRREE
jgi:hypothetical protein